MKHFLPGYLFPPFWQVKWQNFDPRIELIMQAGKMRYFYFALFYNIVSRLALPISCFYVAIRLNALNGHKYFWSLQTFYHYHFVYSIWLYCSVYTPVWMTECYGIWFSLRGIYGRAYLLHGFFFLVLVHCVMYVLKNLHWGNVTIDVIFRILFQFINLCIHVFVM